MNVNTHQLPLLSSPGGGTTSGMLAPGSDLASLLGPSATPLALRFRVLGVFCVEVGVVVVDEIVDGVGDGVEDAVATTVVGVLGVAGIEDEGVDVVEDVEAVVDVVEDMVEDVVEEKPAEEVKVEEDERM